MGAVSLPEIPDAVLEAMHGAYEAAAIREGWSTQESSRVPWANVPEANKRTMRVAVEAVRPLLYAASLRHAADRWDAMRDADDQETPWLREWAAEATTTNSPPR